MNVEHDIYHAAVHWGVKTQIKDTSNMDGSFLMRFLIFILRLLEIQDNLEIIEWIVTFGMNSNNPTLSVEHFISMQRAVKHQKVKNRSFRSEGGGVCVKLYS